MKDPNNPAQPLFAYSFDLLRIQNGKIQEHWDSARKQPGWAKDAELSVAGTTATAGNYIGIGDPDDPATCPPPSGDSSVTGQEGTLCTFFKYVAGGMQPANKFVSLTPAFKTKYVPVKDDGQWKSSVYFECHYFDVSLNAASGQPLWTAKSHVDLYGEARKIDGRWLLTRVSSSAVGVPIP